MFLTTDQTLQVNHAVNLLHKLRATQTKRDQKTTQETIETLSAIIVSGSLPSFDGSQRDNHARADAANAALDAYTGTNSGRYAEETPQTRIADLMCDLLHLARRDWEEDGEQLGTTENVSHLLDMARSNWEEEESEEADEDGDEEEPEDVEDNLRRAQIGGARDPRNDRSN